MKREPNKVVLINAYDMLEEYEAYISKVNGKTVKAKRMTGSFRVTNKQGDERKGNKGDWLIESTDGTLHICWPEVFESNYAKKPILIRLDKESVIDVLGNECREISIVPGEDLQHCFVCDKLVTCKGWRCGENVFHGTCIEWEEE